VEAGEVLSLFHIRLFVGFCPSKNLSLLYQRKDYYQRDKKRRGKLWMEENEIAAALYDLQRLI